MNVRILVSLLASLAAADALAGKVSRGAFDHTSTFGLLTGLRVAGGEPALFHLALEATHNREFFAELFYLGGFAQAETVAFRRFRFALGPQLTFLLAGVETGVAIETAGLGRPSTVEAQFSPFFSFVVGSVACRISVPLDTLERTPPGALPPTSVTIVLTLKWPWIDELPWKEKNRRGEAPSPGPPERRRPPAPKPRPPPPPPPPAEETPKPPAPNEI